MLGTQLVGAVKFAQRSAEVRRRSAHFVDRNKSRVDIAGGVFQPLGHHRSGELLELQSEIQLPAITVNRRLVILAFQQQNAVQEVEHRRSQRSRCAAWRRSIAC